MGKPLHDSFIRTTAAVPSAFRATPSTDLRAAWVRAESSWSWML
jgi:hypothetical protein